MGHDHNPENHAHDLLDDHGKSSADAAFARALAGEATPDDLAILRSRKGVGALWNDALKNITTATDDLSHLPYPPGFDVRTKWYRLAARINTPAEQSLDRWRRYARRFALPASGPGARSMALGLSTVLMVMIGGYFAMPHLPSTTREASLAATVIATRSSQQSTVTLLDGTVVTLNVASRLEIPADFNSGNRTVRLDGEALFSVTPRSGDAFTVIAGGIPTRVLGTTFSIRKYDTDNSVTVAVQDGKVSVRSVVLTANQQAKIGMDDTVWVHPANPAQFRFARGVLDLDGIPVLQAISELNRWYDADIEIGDSALAHRNIKATFSTGSIADMAEVLGLVFDARVVVNGKKVILYSKE